MLKACLSFLILLLVYFNVSPNSSLSAYAGETPIEVASDIEYPEAEHETHDDNENSIDAETTFVRTCHRSQVRLARCAHTAALKTYLESYVDQFHVPPSRLRA